jgi:hypothetical protein
LLLAFSNVDDNLEQVLAGLRLYFDKALGNILLYRFERQQYSDVRKKYPNKPMSELYGSEHFLRLFGERLALCLFLVVFFGGSGGLTLNLSASNSPTSNAYRTHQHGSRVGLHHEGSFESVTAVRSMF